MMCIVQGMMEKWQEENNEEEYNEQFANEWGKQWQSEVPEQSKAIPFETKNQYMENAGDRVAIAKQLIEAGKAQEAIVCLQAEV